MKELYRYISEKAEKVYDDGFFVAYAESWPNGKIRAFAFHGRSNKTDWNFIFKSPESMNAYIQDRANSWKAHNDRKAFERIEKKNSINPFIVGDIISRSWGYDQTNVDFYQVIKATKKQITVRAISASCEEDGYMCGHCVAIKDAFIADAEPQRIGVDKYGSTKLGGKWDGKPEYCSWYA
jgi:hypothetical protein